MALLKLLGIIRKQHGIAELHTESGEWMLSFLTAHNLTGGIFLFERASREGDLQSHLRHNQF